MSEKLEALRELLAKVEAGENSRSDGWATGGFGWDNFDLAATAFHGSLDAAKALHGAMLPGYDALLSLDGEGLCSVLVLPMSERDSKSTYWATTGTNPARVWLIAILKALITEAENHES
jgi:hypothetical protein